MLDAIFTLTNEYTQNASLCAYAVVFAGGVLTSFAACSYPLIPVTVAVIGAQSASSRQKGFVLSLIYVLGVALTYTLLGALASLFGVFFGTVQSSPWSQLFVAVLFIAMGLSLLGLFTMPVCTPSFVAKMRMNNKPKGYLGTFCVGILSGLVMSPCASPILLALLGHTAMSQNIFFGISLFFVFSLGLGTIFIFVGIFSGIIANMPRSGVWLEKINKVCGIILIALGGYFLLQIGALWK